MTHQNKTKRKLKAGEVVFGVTVGVNDVEFVELAGALGFDYAIVDCEHELFSDGGLKGMIRAAAVSSLTVIVRLQNNPERILHVLDTGAQGVLVARVNSRADAQAVVDAAKFHPEGRRTIYYRGRGGNFGLDITSAQQWTQEMNRETLIACIIEEITGVNNLGEILAMPQVDMIELGPLDLAHSMGWPPQQEVDGLVDKIVTESIKAGKAVVTRGDTSTMPKALAKGSRAFSVSPRGYFQTGASQFLKEARELARASNLL